MKIKEIRIENFGRFSDFSMDFSEGINSIVEENGWGKSTLADFIKVMFFGFDGEKKRSDIENERRRYKPWQSGTYGGSLAFEISGKEYRIMRIFGSRDSEDIFKLFDNVSGLESDDYTSAIGEELFKLDSESYKRTVLIGQNDVETAATDGINAKLGNLSGATDDIDNYEAVAEKLKSRINGISHTRSTGEIYSLRNELTGLENEVRNINAVETAAVQKKESLEKLRAELTENRKNKERLNIELKDASKAAAIVSKKKQYDGILIRYAERQSEVEKAKRVFGNRSELYEGMVPGNEQLEHYRSLADGLKRKEKTYAAMQFSEDEKKDYYKYSEKYSGKEAVSEKASGLINDLSEARSKKEALTSKEVLLDSLRLQQTEYKKPSYIWMIIAGVLLVLSGVFLLLKISLPAGALVCAAGAGLLIAGIILQSHAGDNAKRKEDSAACSRLSEEIESEKEYIKSTEKRIRDFLGEFGLPFDFGTGTTYLSEIKNEYQRYMTLKNQKDDMRDDILLEEIAADKRRLDDFLAPFSELFDSNDEYSSKLDKIDYGIQKYNRAVYELDMVEAEKRTFEAENNTDEFRRMAEFEKLRSMDEINADIISVNKSIEKLLDDVNTCDNQLGEILEKLDDLNEKNEKLKETKHEYEKLLDKEKLLIMTRDLLEKAKTGFIAKYSSSVAAGFKKYHELFEGTTGEKYSFDANMNLRIEDHGDYKNPRMYSAGNRDKTGLCFRMGLIEAMYPDEKPVIIMDDPFTNLDGKNLEGGKKLLKIVAEEYQVIYLTCHESRLP